MRVSAMHIRIHVETMCITNNSVWQTHGTDGVKEIAAIRERSPKVISTITQVPFKERNVLMERLLDKCRNTKVQIVYYDRLRIRIRSIYLHTLGVYQIASAIASDRGTAPRFLFHLLELLYYRARALCGHAHYGYIKATYVEKLRARPSARPSTLYNGIARRNRFPKKNGRELRERLLDIHNGHDHPTPLYPLKDTKLRPP